MFKKINKVRKSAFTLVEMLIVVSVIGILSVTLISKADFAVDKTKDLGIQTSFRDFAIAVKQISLEENISKMSTQTLENRLNNMLGDKFDFTQGVSTITDPYDGHYKYIVYKDSNNYTYIIITADGSEKEQIYYLEQ